MERIEILSGWLSGRSPQPSEYGVLLQDAQGNLAQAEALDYDLSLVGIEKRAKEFVAIALEIVELCREMKFTDPNLILNTLWGFWLPLAQQIRQARQQQDQPLIQGVLGAQGTGKTTLSRVLQTILRRWNYPCIAISIDDLYKTYAERHAK